MVFSQTNVNTSNLLKVVDIDRLKSEKNQQVKSAHGENTGGTTVSTPSSPVATTSFSEVRCRRVREYTLRSSTVKLFKFDFIDNV